MTTEEITNRFTYHPPSEAGKQRHGALSDAFAAIASAVDLIVPDGREKALVFTKLEEAKFWASAGVARNEATR